MLDIGFNLVIKNFVRRNGIMSKATTEIEVQVSRAKITGAEVWNDDVLKLVEASKLSLNDKFMRYEPEEGTKEARFKERLTKVIQSGISDFWCPNMDPSFDETGKSICYVAGKRPAVGKSKKWWKKVAKKLGLQEGTKKQRVAFLGCLIKKLVEKGWEVSQAWYAVCSDSKELGHYCNSKYAKHDYEMTGSREVCGFYDLGNTLKVIKRDEEDRAGDFWLAGGHCDYPSTSYPLANLDRCCGTIIPRYYSVVWLVRNCNTDHC